MIEVSTKPPPKAPPSHAGPPMSGGGFNNVQQSSTAFNPPLPGGPPPPGTNQLQSMLQQFGNQGGGNPGGNPGGQGAGGIDQSALQALLQSVQSGALKVQGGPGNGGLNGGGMNGAEDRRRCRREASLLLRSAPPRRSTHPWARGWAAARTTKARCLPAWAAAAWAAVRSIGGSVNNGMIPGQGRATRTRLGGPWRMADRRARCLAGTACAPSSTRRKGATTAITAGSGTSAEPRRRRPAPIQTGDSECLPQSSA